MQQRWRSIARRKQHWAEDRCCYLAKSGMNDEQIAVETGLPLINVRALIAPMRLCPASVKSSSDQGTLT